MTVKKLHRDNFVFGIDEQVKWGDLDAFGHVNNTIYFRWFESARMRVFETIGFDKPDLLDGTGPILAHTQCHYKQPLHYPTSLWVGVIVRDIEDTQFFMDYAVFAQNESRPAAVGSGHIVCFNFQQRQRTQIPTSIRTALNRFV